MAWHCYTAGKDGGSAASQSAFSKFLNFITECSGSDTAAGTDVVTYDVDNFASNLDWASKNLITGGLDDGASGVVFYNLALNDECGPQLPPDGAPSCMGSPKGSSQCRN